MANPFKIGSTQYLDFETLSDLKWHCTKCELKSGQAKTWQVWRQEKGIQMDTDENGKWDKRMFCEKCNCKTVHRKLKSLQILEGTHARTGIPEKLARRIKEIYKNIDEYTFREEPANILEIDHRIPQVRWNSNEDDNSENMSEAEIRTKFMLLTRGNNLLKSRKCEKCKETGMRPAGYGEIDFWWKGGKKYDEHIGCEGCFWHGPRKWSEELNRKIK